MICKILYSGACVVSKRKGDTLKKKKNNNWRLNWKQNHHYQRKFYEESKGENGRKGTKRQAIYTQRHIEILNIHARTKHFE